MAIIKKQIGFRDTQYSYNYLMQYKAKYPDMPLYKLIEIIFEEHAKMKQKLDEQATLANQIIDGVTNQVMPALWQTQHDAAQANQQATATNILANTHILQHGLDDKLFISEIPIASKPLVEAFSQSKQAKFHSQVRGRD